MRIIKTCIASVLVGLMAAGLTSCSMSKRRSAAGEAADAAAPRARQPFAARKWDREYSELAESNGRFNTEEYGHLSENEFLKAVTNPLSTFSIDVDTASYSNVRRVINGGDLPPADAVRIEELINYFSYDYPQPEGDEPFSIAMELSACPWDNAHGLIAIGLQARRVPIEQAPPNNLVFLIDSSGSMETPDKLPLLKSAFKLLVDQLREQDRVAIVTYAGSAGLVLHSTPGSRKEEISAAIDRLEAGGSTAGGAGIQLAYDVARKNRIADGNNRVVLATDGDFNVGITSHGELVRLIEQERESGVFLTVLGFGTGNLKDSRMELLADKGNGNYAYVDSISEARKVLVSELGGTLNTIARDVKIQIEFNPAAVRAYRLIGYENRLLRAEDFNDDKKDAGELGAGHTVTALYEIVPHGAPANLPEIDPLKYQSNKVRREAFAGNELMAVKLRYKPPTGEESLSLTRVLKGSVADATAGSENTRFAAAVAQFGMLLRNSKFKGKSSFDGCLQLATNSRGADPDGYRKEFVELVEKAAGLMSMREQARLDRDFR